MKWWKNGQKREKKGIRKLCFWYEKNPHQTSVFWVNNFLLQISNIILVLKFQNLKHQLIITFDIVAAEYFNAIVGISTPCVLTNTRKWRELEGGKYRYPPTQWSIFEFPKKADISLWNSKVESPFLEQFTFMEPIGVCFASSLKGWNMWNHHHQQYIHNSYFTFSLYCTI